MKFVDEASLEFQSLTRMKQQVIFKSLQQGTRSQSKRKIFGDLQKAARIFWLEVGGTEHSGNRKLWG